MSSLGYPKIVPYTKFEHFGIIQFLSYGPDKQTDGGEHPTKNICEKHNYTCTHVYYTADVSTPSSLVLLVFIDTLNVLYYFYLSK